MPRKTTKPVVAPTTMSPVVFRSSAIWAMPGVNIEEAKGERTGVLVRDALINCVLPNRRSWIERDYYAPAMKAMIPTLRNFRPLGQFLGFSSSSLEKSMIWEWIRWISDDYASQNIQYLFIFVLVVIGLIILE